MLSDDKTRPSPAGPAPRDDVVVRLTSANADVHVALRSDGSVVFRDDQVDPVTKETVVGRNGTIHAYDAMRVRRAFVSLLSVLDAEFTMEQSRRALED